MDYDPQLTEVRDRCRKLAAKIHSGQVTAEDAIHALAQDVATLGDRLNTLLNQLSDRARDGKPKVSPGRF